MIRVQKFVFLRQAILIPTNHFFALGLKRQSESQLRADTIAVRPNVSDDAKGAALADLFQDAVNDFRMCLHESVWIRESVPLDSESTELSFIKGSRRRLIRPRSDRISPTPR